MNRKETKELLNDSKRYFAQQKDLFGNIIYNETVVSISKTIQEDSLISNDPWALTESLDELNNSINTCLKCELGNTRTNFVFGVGNKNAEVMFVGEAPGADEDAQGEPFVGRAGQLLNKILTAVDLKREDVYICNILKCRPPGNRDPQSSEMELCTPYLYKQIMLVQPQFIICLGRIAAQWLLQTNSTLTALRGKIHDYRGTKLIVTYHPAALLRNPNWKYPAWEDMKMFREAYNKTIQK
jgi:uracil-DNA glycosylase